ncbi:MAG: molybdate ABC transporter substrate-binding protein [Actinomycetes bacterium]
MNISEPRMRRRRWSLGAVAAAGLLVCGCSTVGSTSSSPTVPAPARGSITVAAASSLSKVFPALARGFEKVHHGATITFDFGSSGTLATSISAGAPADVFASAALSSMAPLVSAGLVAGRSIPFASNALEIITKPGNPLGIHALSDLVKAKVVALCVVTAPCGATAQAALSKAGVHLPEGQVTVAPDVDTTAAAVTTGDADAAIVYVTNARSETGHAQGVPIPKKENVVTTYPIAVMAASQNKSLAKAWVTYVQSPIGQAALHSAGFSPAA